MMAQFLKNTPLHGPLHRLRLHQDYWNWKLSGGNTPHLQKQRIVKEYASKWRTRTLVETGTYLGDMVSAMLVQFQAIYSIEIEKRLYERAVRKFADQLHVRLYLGDSRRVLPEIVPLLSHPVLFWLDGHYSGGVTGKGECETPIMDELKLLFRQPTHGDVILIDDARCFEGQNDYPTLAQVADLARSWNYGISVVDDVIRLVPIDSAA